ncbi:MAG: hypothetical protein V1832_00990 [Nitrospirota bacterium]|jgi:hypothetical protein
MKKAALFVLALVMLVGFAIQDTQAGEWCWQDGNGEYIKVTVAKPDPLLPHKSLNGIWYSPSSWLLPVVGTTDKDTGGTSRRVGLHGTYLSGADLYDYVLDATIDPVTKNGTIYIYSSFLGVTNSFSLTKIDCATAPAP